ncbi:hypothetical protein CFP56_007699 [Quercus suber]|uniref:N-acetyltransferase domain-containing protein n=1 Tax=Quercus suber TaxID=58331 RepID=A0AAW0ID10_QUESU
MAHLVANHRIIPKKLCIEPSNGNTRGLKQGRTSNYLMGYGESWRINAGLQSGKILMKARRFVVHSSTSSAEEVGLVGDGKFAEGQFGYLVNEYGWKVRRLVENADEMRKAAQIQAEAFHVPLALFNDLFFDFFQPTTNASDSQKQVVGIVDVTVLRDKSVLQYLPAAEVEEYLYVSGIAVLKSFRRQKIATLLLKACDVLSVMWGFEYLALRAYEDDFGARKLYTNAGYRVVSGDPQWMTTWIGRKRRVLMIKRSNLHTFNQAT